MAPSTTGWIPPDKVPEGTLQAPYQNRAPPDGTPGPPDPPSDLPDDILNRPARVVRRTDWGARDPKWVIELLTPIKKIVLTWTETEPCYTEQDCKILVRNIQEAHMADPAISDIKHNFLLGRDGALYEGRGFTTVGPAYSEAASKGHQLTGESIEVAFIEKCTNKPSPLLLKVLSECIAFGVGGKFIEKAFDFYWMSEKDVIYIQPTMLGQSTSNNNDDILNKESAPLVKDG